MLNGAEIHKIASRNRISSSHDRTVDLIRPIEQFQSTNHYNQKYVQHLNDEIINK